MTMNLVGKMQHLSAPLASKIMLNGHEFQSTHYSAHSSTYYAGKLHSKPINLRLFTLFSDLCRWRRIMSETCSNFSGGMTTTDHSGREYPRKYLESTPDSRASATRPVLATCKM